jgi:hypothetical protein
MNREATPDPDSLPMQALQAAWLAWAAGLLKNNQMPLSGNVDQWIRSWGEAVSQIGLFNVNIAGSGDPALENDIVSRYSYGRQLGRILEVLAPLVDASEARIKDKAALADFRQMVAHIASLKRRGVAEVAAEIESWRGTPGFEQDVADLKRRLDDMSKGKP